VLKEGALSITDQSVSYDHPHIHLSAFEWHSSNEITNYQTVVTAVPGFHTLEEIMGVQLEQQLQATTDFSHPSSTDFKQLLQIINKST
jgi:hypothetical protein